MYEILLGCRLRRKISFYIFYLLLAAAQNNVIAQSVNWQNYTSTESIKALLIDGNELWIAVNGPTASLVKMNLITRNLVFYNTISSGLPDNNFYAVAKESNGIKWFGSRKGLIKFENDAFSTLDPSNSPLPDTMVSALLIDHEQKKWIGTFRSGSFGTGDLGGLAKFDGIHWTVYRMDNSPLPNNNITAIAQQNNSTIWIGTINGLVRIFDDIWTVFTVFNSELLSNTITCLEVDDKDNIWIGTGDGLSKYENGVWTNYTFGTQGSIQNQVQCLKFANNRIFVGLYEGLKSFDGVEWSDHVTPADHSVKAITADSENNLWVGTNYRLGKITFQDNYNTLYEFNIGNSKLPSNYVKQVAFNSDGYAWICTNLGIAKFDGINWEIYNDKNLLLTERDISFTSVAVEASNNLWFATNTGLVLHLLDGDIVKYDTTNSPIKYPVTSIVVDKDYNKWFGTVKGIHKLTDTAWTTFNADNSQLTNDYVNSLTVSETNDVYIATYEGVFVYCNNCDDPWSRIIPEPIGSLGNQIASVAIDSSDNLWLGTFGAGLYKYDVINQYWTNYHTNNSQIPDNYINSITVDKNNNLWLSTGNTPTQGGISNFNGETFINYSVSNSPLLYNIISFIGIDKFNNKWICTNGGGLAVLDDNLTDIEIDPPPADFYLSQNYPNPFNPVTSIKYQIAQPSNVSIIVYDVLGNKVKEIVNSKQLPGNYEVRFYAADLVSGMYMYQLKAGEVILTKKMLLIK